MSDNLRGRIAETVWIAHRDRQLAQLGMKPSEYAADIPTPDWAYAMADAILSMPGIAVIELPEPDKGRDDWLDATVHVDKPPYRKVGDVVIELDPGAAVVYTSPTWAREFAAAVLAAADYAEREQ